jgi:hypothetical protein
VQKVSQEGDSSVDIEGVVAWGDVFRMLALLAALCFSFWMGRVYEEVRRDDEDE